MAEKYLKSFVMYADLEGVIKRLSMEERGMLLTNLYSYANRGETEEGCSTPLVDMAFEVVRTHLDRDREKYERICERNAENGKLGGRPKKPKETERFSEKPKKAYSNSNNKNKSYNYSYGYSESERERERSYDVDDFFNASLERMRNEDI